MLAESNRKTLSLERAASISAAFGDVVARFGTKSENLARAFESFLGQVRRPRPEEALPGSRCRRHLIDYFAARRNASESSAVRIRSRQMWLRRDGASWRSVAGLAQQALNMFAQSAAGGGCRLLR